jgi:hypothetical protein
MPESTIKKQLHQYIDMINNESQLEILYETAEAYAKGGKPDILDSLNPKQLERLQETIKQADKGKLTPHEKVLKISKQLLTK